MAVQQDKLVPVNTGVDFENINNVKADRILHNGSNYIKCEFQSDKPFEGSYANTQSGTLNFTDRSEYVDGEFTAIASVQAYHLQVEYPNVISTNEIKIYSTSLITHSGSPVTNIEVFKSFTDNEGDLTSVTHSGMTRVFRSDISPSQYEYTVDLGETFEGKLWRLSFLGEYDYGGGPVLDSVLSPDVTEVIVKDRPAPKLVYFQTDGDQSTSFTMEEEDVLDLTYDSVNDTYYTIRYNDQLVGSAESPDDDFTTVSGETSFNPIRWSEDEDAPSFSRSLANDNLTYFTSSGDGRLSSNYTLQGDLDLTIDYDITTMTSSGSFFGLHAVDAETNSFLYGVGVTPRGSDTYYQAAILSFVNNTTSADLLNLEVNLENTSLGSENWTVRYNSSLDEWSVSGSVNGAQTAADTGASYVNDYISFQVSAVSTQVNNDEFTFTVDYGEVSRAVSSGTLDVSRAGTGFSSTLSGSFSATVTSGDVNIQLVGTTDQLIDMTADDFTVTSGTAVYPSVPVFTVEEVDDEGQVQQIVIEKFNIIKDPNAFYNNYLNGAVQIAIDGAQVMYAKVLDRIYRFSVASPIIGLVD